MSSTRSIISPPQFATNALTVIPPTPVAGVTYRDPAAGPLSSPDGWPYAERVNSAEFNQIMYQLSGLVSILDKKGVLGWSSSVDYSEAAIAFGSDGVLYSWLAASGPTLGGAKDPSGGANPTFWKATITSIPVSTDGIAGSAANLKISATGTNATVAITADSICLKNSASEQTVINSVSLSPSLTNPIGANGLDSGVVGGVASTWYAIYVIWNPTTLARAGLFSTSPTSPVMPSGFTHKARVGWGRTDSTSKFFMSYIQVGRLARWVLAPGTNVTALPLITSGAAGSTTAPTWVGTSISSYAPPTAIKISMSLFTSNSVNAAVAPSANYGALGIAGAPGQQPPLQASNAAGNSSGSSIDLPLLSTTIYYVSSGAAYLSSIGWEDSL